MKLPLQYERLSDGTEIGRFQRDHGEFVFVCKDGIPVSLPYSDIALTEDGYIAHFGKDAYKLDRNGNNVSWPNYQNNFTDFVRGVADDFMRSYLQLVRESLLAEMTATNSSFASYIKGVNIQVQHTYGVF